MVKLKVHENEMKRQRVKDNFKNQQRAENKKRIQAYKAQREAMIQQSKWFFKNESEWKAQLRKQEEEYEKKWQAILDLRQEREEQEEMERDELIYQIEKKALSTRMKYKNKIESDKMKLHEKNLAVELKRQQIA